MLPGIFALSGVFIGAWLTRYTEYKKWLRQQRSISFAEFISQFEKVNQESSDIINDHNLSNEQQDLEITKIFVKFKSKENIVRLYLKHNDRKLLSSFVDGLWSLHNPDITQITRLKKREKITKQIQSIFESTIDRK